MANPTPGERPIWVNDRLFPFESHFVEIDGHVVHYVDEGEGPPLLLYHGNPTWGFLYRDVIAGLKDQFRCVAVDYPGFGLSSSALGYGFTVAEHADVMERFVETLDLRDVVYMAQDWGGPIGTAVASRHPERYQGLIVGNTWAWRREDRLSPTFSAVMGGAFGGLLVKRFNIFVDQLLPLNHRRRKLSDAEMAHYRGPFPDDESRIPIHVMPREIVHATALLDEAAAGLASLAHLPALILWADKDPGFTEADRARWRQEFPNNREHTLLGVGHYFQDDAGDEVVEVIRDWWPPQP